MTPESSVAHESDFVPIQIDHRPYRAPRREMTGDELRALAGITSEYELWLEVPGPADDIRVPDTDLFPLRPGNHFYSVPRTINPGR
jgi:hypothetical protein